MPRLRPERHFEVQCSSGKDKDIPGWHATQSWGQEGTSGSEKGGQNMGARKDVPDMWAVHTFTGHLMSLDFILRQWNILHGIWEEAWHYHIFNFKNITLDPAQIPKPNLRPFGLKPWIPTNAPPFTSALSCAFKSFSQQIITDFALRANIPFRHCGYNVQQKC